MTKMALIFCLITLITAADHQLAKLRAPSISADFAPYIANESNAIQQADSSPHLDGASSPASPAPPTLGAPIPTGLQDEDTWAPGSPKQLINQHLAY